MICRAMNRVKERSDKRGEVLSSGRITSMIVSDLNFVKQHSLMHGI